MARPASSHVQAGGGTGTIKVGSFEYNVKLNNSPSVVDELNRLPVKQVNGATIYMGDVAHVRDGSPPQRNEVRMDVFG